MSLPATSFSPPHARRPRGVGEFQINFTVPQDFARGHVAGEYQFLAARSGSDSHPALRRKPACTPARSCRSMKNTRETALLNLLELCL